MAKKNQPEHTEDGVVVDARTENSDGRPETMKMVFFNRVHKKLILTDIGCQYIANMVAMGCTIDDIADELGVSKQTLYTAHNRPKLDDAVKTGQGRLKNSLRMAQVKTACRGNPAMLIFLGKNLLGQSDSPVEEQNDVSPMNEFAKAFAQREQDLQNGSDDDGKDESSD